MAPCLVTEFFSKLVSYNVCIRFALHLKANFPIENNLNCKSYNLRC